MNKKKGFRKDNFSTDVETLVVAPIMDVNICPMTTHIMASDLTPFNTFKSESGLRLNIFTVYCTLNADMLFFGLVSDEYTTKNTKLTMIMEVR